MKEKGGGKLCKARWVQPAVEAWAQLAKRGEEFGAEVCGMRRPGGKMGR